MTKKTEQQNIEQKNKTHESTTSTSDDNKMGTKIGGAIWQWCASIVNDSDTLWGSINRKGAIDLERCPRVVGNPRIIDTMHSRILQRDNSAVWSDEISVKKNWKKTSMAYLSTLPTEITCSAVAGLEAYQEPEAPSLPAATVTIFPLLLILSATTAEDEADQPLLLPKKRVRISMPSLTPWRRLSTRTVINKKGWSWFHAECQRVTTYCCWSYDQRNRTLCMRLVWRHTQVQTR